MTHPAGLHRDDRLTRPRVGHHDGDEGHRFTLAHGHHTSDLSCHVRSLSGVRASGRPVVRSFGSGASVSWDGDGRPVPARLPLTARLP